MFGIDLDLILPLVKGKEEAETIVLNNMITVTESHLDGKTAIVGSLLEICMRQVRDRFADIGVQVQLLLERLLHIEASLRQFSKQNRSLAKELEAAGYVVMASEKKRLSLIEKDLCVRSNTLLQLSTNRMAHGSGVDILGAANARDIFLREVSAALTDFPLTNETALRSPPTQSIFAPPEHVGDIRKEAGADTARVSTPASVDAAKRKRSASDGDACIGLNAPLVAAHVDAPSRHCKRLRSDNDDTLSFITEQTTPQPVALLPSVDTSCVGRPAPGNSGNKSNPIASSSDSGNCSPHPHQTPAQYVPSPAASTATPEVSQPSGHSAVSSNITTGGERDCAATANAVVIAVAGDSVDGIGLRDMLGIVGRRIEHDDDGEDRYVHRGDSDSEDSGVCVNDSDRELLEPLEEEDRQHSTHTEVDDHNHDEESEEKPATEKEVIANGEPEVLHRSRQIMINGGVHHQHASSPSINTPSPEVCALTSSKSLPVPSNKVVSDIGSLVHGRHTQDVDSVQRTVSSMRDETRSTVAGIGAMGTEVGVKSYSC